MKKTELILLLLIVRAMSLLGGNWQGAQWICPEENKNQANTWMGFRKEVHISKVPQTAFAKILSEFMMKDITIYRNDIKSFHTLDSIDKLKEVCFAHPTYSEGIFEALFK